MSLSSTDYKHLLNKNNPKRIKNFDDNNGTAKKLKVDGFSNISQFSWPQSILCMESYIHDSLKEENSQKNCNKEGDVKNTEAHKEELFESFDFSLENNLNEEDFNDPELILLFNGDSSAKRPLKEKILSKDASITNKNDEENDNFEDTESQNYIPLDFDLNSLKCEGIIEKLEKRIFQMDKLVGPTIDSLEGSLFKDENDKRLRPLATCLKNELENLDKVFTYSASNHQSAVLYDIYTGFLRKIWNHPFLFSFRGTDMFVEPFRNIDQLVEQVMKIQNNAYKKLNDHEIAFRWMFLPQNIYLFGNYGVTGESTIWPFLKDDSINPVNTAALFENFLELYHLETNSATKDKFNNLMNLSHSRLYQFMIDPSYIDQISYPCNEVGKGIKNDKTERTCGSVLKEIYNMRRKGIEKLTDPYFFQAQSRLFLHSTLWDYEKIKIFEYWHPDQSAENKKKYYLLMEKLIQQMTSQFYLRGYQISEYKLPRISPSLSGALTKLPYGDSPCLAAAILIMNKTRVGELIFQNPALLLKPLKIPFISEENTKYSLPLTFALKKGFFKIAEMILDKMFEVHDETTVERLLRDSYNKEISTYNKVAYYLIRGENKNLTVQTFAQKVFSFIPHLNFVNSEGETPLHLATSYQNILLMKIILNHKGNTNISIKSHSGKTPFDYALEDSFTEGMKLLTHGKQTQHN